MKMRSVLFVLVVQAMAVIAGRAEAACEAIKAAELPVTMTPVGPRVPVTVNGMSSAFVISTGAAMNNMSAKSAAELKLTPVPIRQGMVVRSGDGRNQDAGVITVKDFALGGFHIKDVDFLVLENDAFYGRATELGENMIGQMDTEFDLANGVIRLFSTTGCENTRLAYWVTTQPYSVIHIDRGAQLGMTVVGTGQVNKRPVRVRFDTGMPRSTLTTSAAALAGVKPGDPGVTQAGKVDLGHGHMAQNWVGPFDSFKLGDEEVQHTRLRFADVKSPDVDMILGADFFLSHRVYISQKQHELYFTYNGGPVFNLDTPPNPNAPDQQAAPMDKANSDEPTDAAGFELRAAAFITRQDYAQAIANLDKAIALQPAEPKYVYERARAEVHAGEFERAAADFDLAVKVKPDNPDALLARADFNLAGKDKLATKQDLDAVDRLVPRDSSSRVLLAFTYEKAGFREEMIHQVSEWIDTHPLDYQMAWALNARCWSRALLNKDLKLALADCNGAIKLDPRDSGPIDSRALVYLRLGDLDRAMADYRTSLSLVANRPWSLYGKGLVELKRGRKREGDADIAAAFALQPGLADEVKAVGLVP